MGVVASLGLSFNVDSLHVKRGALDTVLHPVKVFGSCSVRCYTGASLMPFPSCGGPTGTTSHCSSRLDAVFKIRPETDGSFRSGSVCGVAGVL